MMRGRTAGRSPSTMWRSVRQTPQAITLRRTWLERGRGVGTSSTLTQLPEVVEPEWKTAARIGGVLRFRLIPRSNPLDSYAGELVGCMYPVFCFTNQQVSAALRHSESASQRVVITCTTDYFVTRDFEFVQ